MFYESLSLSLHIHKKKASIIICAHHIRVKTSSAPHVPTVPQTRGGRLTATGHAMGQGTPGTHAEIVIVQHPRRSNQGASSAALSLSHSLNWSNRPSLAFLFQEEEEHNLVRRFFFEPLVLQIFHCVRFPRSGFVGDCFDRCGVAHQTTTFSCTYRAQPAAYRIRWCTQLGTSIITLLFMYGSFDDLVNTF